MPLHKIYALPVPIRTFPLPSFYPNNPISWLHVAYIWLNQALFPPAPEPSVVHQGTWSPATRSVHITDSTSARALWEQGFFGKGNLSRSEPNWLKRERARKAMVDDPSLITSEMRTAQRRQERENSKWERGRIEQAAIDRKRREEAQKAAGTTDRKAMTGKQTALRPNGTNCERQLNGHSQEVFLVPPVGPLQLLALPNSEADLRNMARDESSSPDANTSALASANAAPKYPGYLEAQAIGSLKLTNGINGHSQMPSGQANGTELVEDDFEPGQTPLKRTKSVRFSPTVESTTFQCSDPPSPNHKLLASRATAEGPELAPIQGNGTAISGSINGHYLMQTLADVQIAQDSDVDIPDKEHLQLSAEEALFLVFAVGSLRVINPQTKADFTTEQLFTLFREYSAFPARDTPSPADAFILHYAVYHHFRSMGWVVRHGMKFGVDWLLYNKYVPRQAGPLRKQLTNSHIQGALYFITPSSE